MWRIWEHADAQGYGAVLEGSNRPRKGRETAAVRPVLSGRTAAVSVQAEAGEPCTPASASEEPRDQSSVVADTDG